MGTRLGGVTGSGGLGPSGRHRRDGRAFTLIELLVVVAILALLITMLVPSLQRARDMAQRMRCATNLRGVGTAMHLFAGEHEGRAPGHGITNSGQEFGLKSFLSQALGNKLQGMGNRPLKGYFYCPSMAPVGSTTYVSRAWLYNRDLEGGPHNHPHDPGDPQGQKGPYGKVYVPPPGGWELYTLGCVLGEFPRPSYQFMTWESEASTDYTGYRSDTPAQIPLGGGPNPWCAIYGHWAFRHVLPRDRALYQAQATACFLFVDSHVEILTPRAPINLKDRFAFKP